MKFEFRVAMKIFMLTAAKVGVSVQTLLFIILGIIWE